MNGDYLDLTGPARRSRLAASIGLAFALGASSVYARLPQPAGRGVGGPHVAVSASTDVEPGREPDVLPVFNCADTGPGSLRDAVASAISGDVIDMTALACSVISLDSGPLLVPMDALTLLGPGSDRLAITSPYGFGAINHQGFGTLYVRHITVRGTTALYAGGCIYSTGSVYLESTVVSECRATDFLGGNDVAGGGVYAEGIVELVNSQVADSWAAADGDGQARGGGISAGFGLLMHDSTISGNIAASANGFAFGGGAHTYKYAEISGSTIAFNEAGYLTYPGNIGGVSIVGYGTISAPVTITNSTISYNVATGVIGGLYTSSPLSLQNSTVVFNAAYGRGAGGNYFAAGVHVYETSANLSSSIIARNLAARYEFDLTGFGETITGSRNLIMGSLISPPDTIVDDPELGPLQDNGGPTLTHALSATSPAIDRGSDNGLSSDQRGPPYVRVAGAAADIGAFELQQSIDDRIFANGFDP